MNEAIEVQRQKVAALRQQEEQVKEDLTQAVHTLRQMEHDAAPEKMRCPTREGTPMCREEGDADHWQMRGNDRCCSFCGSWHPDEFEAFLDAVIEEREGFLIDPSTKGNKWYVQRPGIPNATHGAIKFYGYHAPHHDAEALARMNSKLRQAIEISSRKFAERFGGRFA